jgi:hypothetical protein
VPSNEFTVRRAASALLIAAAAILGPMAVGIAERSIGSAHVLGEPDDPTHECSAANKPDSASLAC